MSRHNRDAENRWRNRQNELNKNLNSDESYLYKLSVRLVHIYPDLNQNELYDNLLKIHKELGDYNWASEVSNNNRNNADTNNNGYNGNNNRTVINENNQNTYPGNENQSVGGRRKVRRKTRKHTRK